MKRPDVGPGKPIRADHITAIYDALDRLDFGVAAPLQLNKSAGKTVISLGLGDSGIIGRVAVDISAATSSGYGTGNVIPMVDNGTSLIDSAGLVPVKNLLDKRIVHGTTSWVVCVRALGSYWVVAVFDCGMLV